MSLASLVSQEKWNAFDDAWTEHMLEGGTVEPVLEALALVAEKKKLPRCLGLTRDHAELLVQAGQPEQAAELLGSAMLWGGSPGELATPLFHAAEAAYSEESWWSAYAEMAGLNAGVQDMRTAWKRFEMLMAMTEGRAVHHAKGWGPGRIYELDRDDLEIRVEFVGGRRDRFPLSSAIDIFEVLEPDDLRAVQVLDPAGLKRKLKEEHLEVLTAVLKRFRGKASYNVIKNALVQLGQTPSGFSAWWRTTRKLAETSGWYDVQGTGAKAQVQIRYSASDPTENVKRQLQHARDLSALLTRVRGLLAGGGQDLDDTVRKVTLQVLTQAAANEDEQLSSRLGAWMLLRDQTSQTPEALTQLLQSAAAEPDPADPSQPPALWQLFQEMPGAREQERCIALLQEVLEGEAWLDAVCRHLPHAAPGMVRPAVEAMLEGQRQSDLAEHYANLLARPRRNPHVLVALADLAENGRIQGDLPNSLQRAQVLMSLAVHLEESKTANIPIQRTRTRMVTMLTSGSPSVLRRLLSEADAAQLRSMVNLAGRGIDGAIDNELTTIVVERAPEVYRSQDKPFWQTGGIWTTRRGFERQQAELRLLQDVKIPENSEAIGRAASFGDLSENSEWEAAIEEQRNLTSRAMAMEAELRTARLIDEANIPEGTAAPGTSVRYAELPGGAENTVSILGPWDSEEENAISYRSPLASGMLGLKAGEEAVIQLPAGSVQVRVLEVRLLPL